MMGGVPAASAGAACGRNFGDGAPPAASSCPHVSPAVALVKLTTKFLVLREVEHWPGTMPDRSRLWRRKCRSGLEQVKVMSICRKQTKKMACPSKYKAQTKETIGRQKTAQQGTKQ